MFTMDSMTFKATRAQVKLMAEVCRLRHEHTSNKADIRDSIYPSYTGRLYDLWEDRQTGGGACRLVWKNGVVWVSRHSGYAYADITQEVCDLFRDMGCKPTTGRNPHIYID